MNTIYMDHNATTPLDERALDAMLPYLRGEFGNAASRNHAYGRRARAAVEQARHQVAALIGARAEEIVWTSGATESDNLAVLGGTEAYVERGRHVVTGATEHKAVLDPCRHLARQGYSVTTLPVDATGRVDPAHLGEALRPDTALVSLMLANNELGTLHPVAAYGRLCKERGVLLHCDAAQAVGKVPVDVEELGVDLLSLSGHKLHGPKGVGALYVRSKRPRVRCRPILHGGGHEDGRRSGTLNVPGIVGLGAACALAAAELDEEAARLGALRDRLWGGLQRAIPGLGRNGHATQCLPNTLNVRIPGITADQIFWALGDRLAISSGSACTTSSLEPSYVILALGLSADDAYASLRFSLGRRNTEAEVDQAVAMLSSTVAAIRQRQPAPAAADPSALELSGLFD